MNFYSKTRFQKLWRYFFNSIYVPAINIKRLLLVICLVRFYDRSAPLLGDIANNGFAKFSLSDHARLFLNGKFDSTNINLTEDFLPSIEEIISLSLPCCEDYIGGNLIISHIAFWETGGNDVNTISNNWHTDNVGHNLKIFCCLEGDGSQPTKVLKNSNLLPLGFNSNLFIQIKRWQGHKVVTEFEEEINIAHKTGSIYIFDTNSLHRGGYEGTQHTRRIFEIDLIDRSKYNAIIKNKYKGLQPMNLAATNNFKMKFNYKSLL